MRSAITVCLVPQAKAGPFVFHEGLADGARRAAELGFDAIEIFPPAPSAIDTAELQALLDQYKLKVAAFGTGAGWIIHQLSLTSPNSETRTKAREFIEATIELAGGFGAPIIIGSMQGRSDATVSREQALTWLAEALEELGELAGEHHTTVLYEPLNRYETNLFNHVAETADWLGKLRTKNVRILADLFHMQIEESDLAAAIRHAGAAIGHVHFADSNRRAVGLGHANLAPVITALRDIGYSGYLSAEVFPLPDPDIAARQTIESFRKLTHA